VRGQPADHVDHIKNLLQRLVTIGVDNISLSIYDITPKLDQLGFRLVPNSNKQINTIELLFLKLVSVPQKFIVGHKNFGIPVVQAKIASQISPSFSIEAYDVGEF
jgi:hypothetical protein